MADETAREDGAALLAAVTRAISAERMRAAATGRNLQDADLARAVLASPALQDANRKILDGMLAEAKPRVTAAIETAALERFGDIITAGVDRQLAERMPVIEAAIRANERRRIRRGVLACELILQHPGDGDRVAVLTLDLERVIGAEDGSEAEGQERTDEEGRTP